MVVAQQVQNAVNEQGAQFVGKGAFALPGQRAVAFAVLMDLFPAIRDMCLFILDIAR